MAEHPIEGMMGVTMEKSASWWMPIPSLANRSRWMEQPSSPFPALPLALPPAALMLAQNQQADVWRRHRRGRFHCTHRVFGDQRRQCAHHPAGGTCQPGGQRYQRSAGPCGPHQHSNQKGQARNPAGISGQISFFPNRNPAQSGLFN